MLMQLGPFQFSVPTYSVERIGYDVTARVAPQQVIGAAPITHLLGPGDETVRLSSTFYPRHLNVGGLAQLEGVRAACRAQTPMMMVSIAGTVFGNWIITNVGDESSMIISSGIAERVTVELTLLQYNDRGSRFGLF